jgi:DNA helicase HerA-like ATPase
MRLVNMGRNFGNGYMAITRRPANVDTTVFELADHIFLFRLRGRNDKRFCEELLDGENADFAEMIPTLPNYEYLYIAPQSNVVKCPPLKL